MKKKMLLVLLLIPALAICPHAEEQDAAFTRVIEIDDELNKLIAERDGLISQKTDSTNVFDNYETIYRDGQYKVGTDIPAGEYVFFSTGKFSGSLKETTDSNGSDRIDSEYFAYNVIYTITDGNYLTIEDAFAVPYNEVTSLITNKGAGMFKIGDHIPAGEYRLIPTKFGTAASFRVFSNSELGNRDSRIDSDYFTSVTYVNVHDGEYLQIDECLFIE